jgi:hypothetical protein
MMVDPRVEMGWIHGELTIINPIPRSFNMPMVSQSECIPYIQFLRMFHVVKGRGEAMIFAGPKTVVPSLVNIQKTMENHHVIAG